MNDKSMTPAVRATSRAAEEPHASAQDGEQTSRSVVASAASTLAEAASTIADAATSTISGAAASLAGAASTIADAASSAADAASSPVKAAARPILHEVDGLATSARRRLDERDGARIRRLRRRASRPLANLWEVHPEARRASLRELGLQPISLDSIAGTAVEGPAQRGGDFLPLRERRTEAWRGRWQRVRQAVDSLVNLPPIDVMKLDGEYWVVDGHNRVAAALYAGAVAIDANVVELRVPGRGAQSTREVPFAAYLETSHALRAAGRGRLSRPTTGVEREPGDAPDPYHERG